MDATQLLDIINQAALECAATRLPFFADVRAALVVRVGAQADRDAARAIIDQTLREMASDLEKWRRTMLQHLALAVSRAPTPADPLPARIYAADGQTIGTPTGATRRRAVLAVRWTSGVITWLQYAALTVRPDGDWQVIQ